MIEQHTLDGKVIFKGGYKRIKSAMQASLRKNGYMIDKWSNYVKYIDGIEYSYAFDIKTYNLMIDGKGAEEIPYWKPEI